MSTVVQHFYLSLQLLFFHVLLSLQYVNAQNVRIATFNSALNRSEKGALLQELLSENTSNQLSNVAEIIQRVNPDILILQEFDYDKEDRALRLFEEKYLARVQNGAKPIDFPYFYLPETNTGYPSGEDFDNDGKYDGPGDAFGFGTFPGQYAFLILSRFPIDLQNVRTFQRFLWKDMPNAKLPLKPENKESYYNELAKNAFRLSSKNHVDLPIIINQDTLHLLVAHPTPPVFDGPEDKNGKRNYDEIRLFADYIAEGKADYLYDDKGKKGGLSDNAFFVIGGDMNADPFDGDSYNQAIKQLLLHPNVYSGLIKGKKVPKSKGGLENAQQKQDKQLGNPAFDTSSWGLRVDYLIPSKNIKIKKSGVFWPPTNNKLHYLVKDNASSDHRLVWIDIELNE
ncbi:MAG: endonuclease/exonuclease/phosphatase family protein [Bacteroidota bacterium]